MNKQTILVTLIAVFVLVGGIVVMNVLGGAKKTSTEPEPTPEVVYQEVDESVQASIAANSAKTKVTFAITGLDDRFSKIEYELTYETDNNGTQGAFGEDDLLGNDFEKEVELGSCSTGGKCTYDKGVRNFKLNAKLQALDGQIFLLRREFPSI